MTHKYAVLGTGSWGTTLANLLAINDNQVIIWGRDQQQVEQINQQHQNNQYLPKAKLDKKLVATDSLESALTEAEIVLSVVPTKATEMVIQQVAQIIGDQKIIIGHATKGLQPDTNLRISQIIEKNLPAKNRHSLFFIAGPSHAESVINQELTAISIAGTDPALNHEIQADLSNRRMRVYSNQDLIGSEYASAFKNVIAIAGGALQAAGFDADNTSAALITRSLNEMTKLVTALGGQADTLLGLVGLGDLIVTATSVNSRNYRAGQLLASRKKPEQIQQEMGMVIEGFNTTQITHQLIQELQLDLPIFESVFQLVYNDGEVIELVNQLMDRPLKSESD